MKKKNLLSFTAAVALVGVIGVGATLAYFTDNQEVSNIITVGHVDIMLTENNVTLGKDENGKRVWIQDKSVEGITEEGIIFQGALPGDTIPKNPTVTIKDDSEDAYIRVKLDFVPTSDNGIDEDSLKILADRLYADIVEAGVWNRNGGYLYYPTRLTATDAVTVFEQVKIPGSWDNVTADKSFTINITAEAIQAENVEDIITTDVNGKVIGWDLGTGPDAIQIEQYPVQ